MATFVPTKPVTASCIFISPGSSSESILSKVKFWVRLHDRACLNVLKGFLQDDKHAFWCEAEHGIGVAPAPGNTNQDQKRFSLVDYHVHP